MSDWPLTVTLHLARAFEQAHAAYMLVGSLASSFHGQVRATFDVDLVTDLRPERAAAFVHALGDEFYADEEAIRQALTEGRHFNVIHIASGFKADVYVVGDSPFTRQELTRRRRESVRSEPKAEVFVAAPEDVILSKLRWYRDGGEVSDQQWNDVIGIMRVQEDGLDGAYLRHWAGQLNVTDLLGRALEQARS